jgi:hypothetical protein
MQTLLLEYKKTNTTKLRMTKSRTAISSIGLVIPFYPSMQDEKAIQAVLRNAKHDFQTKLKDSYEQVCINNVLSRLEKLFSNLNYNSHCKSIAVLLTHEEENVTYP